MKGYTARGGNLTNRLHLGQEHKQPFQGKIVMESVEVKRKIVTKNVTKDRKIGLGDWPTWRLGGGREKRAFHVRWWGGGVYPFYGLILRRRLRNRKGERMADDKRTFPPHDPPTAVPERLPR